MQMKNAHLFLATAIAAAATAGVLTAPAPRPGVDWPSFRGINAAGVADGFPTLAKWDVPKKEGVRWNVPVDGLGHSSPIVWGDRVCLTTAISGKKDAGLRTGLYGDIDSVNDDTVHVWKLLCFNKKTGATTLDKTILSGVPKVKRHMKSTHASSTLATDGAYLVAMLGSEGLYAFDMSGTPLWKKDLGLLDSGYYMAPEAQWEFGSSPVIHDGVIVIQADVEKPKPGAGPGVTSSFLAAFDAKTGKELWRTPRTDDVPTWGTPTIHQVGTQTQIIVNGWHHAGAYDFKTGQEIWRLNGGGDIPVPTPIVGTGLIYLTNAHGSGAPVYAIRETAKGDISLKPGETSNANIVWSVPRDGGYLITPVLYRGLLYVCKSNGVFIAFDAATGERVYQQRLGDGATAFTASLVAADGKVYFTSEDGDVYAVKAGRTFELAGQGSLGEVDMATPAVSEGVIFFRTSKSLIAIGG
jgi:outer membrane protein assembly factor BamB